LYWNEEQLDGAGHLISDENGIVVLGYFVDKTVLYTEEEE
jgi:hypothetical protein